MAPGRLCKFHAPSPAHKLLLLSIFHDQISCDDHMHVFFLAKLHGFRNLACLCVNDKMFMNAIVQPWHLLMMLNTAPLY